MGVADEHKRLFLIGEERGGQLLKPLGEQAAEGLELVIENIGEIILNAVLVRVGSFTADDREDRTVVERGVIHMADAGGNPDGYQFSAAAERVVPDLLRAVRDPDGGQVSASVEG